MGWASRANPNAQALRRGEIRPRLKPQKRVSLRERLFNEAWANMRARQALSLMGKLSTFVPNW